MSVRLPVFSLSGVVAGQNGAIDLSSLNLSAAPVDPIEGPFGHLLCLNDSGVTFTLAPEHQRQKETAVPANRIVIVEIPPGEARMIWTILAVYPYVYTPQCFLFYYLPYEPVRIHDLGAVSAGQIGNQSRVIALPATVLPRSGFWQPVAAGNTFAITTVVYPSITVGTAISSYLYAFEGGIYPAAAADNLDFAVQVNLIDTSSAVVAGPQTMYRCVRGNSAAASVSVPGAAWNPTVAGAVVFSGWAAGAGPPYTLQWFLNALAVTGTPSLSFTIYLDTPAVSGRGSPGSITTFTPMTLAF